MTQRFTRRGFIELGAAASLAALGTWALPADAAARQGGRRPGTDDWVDADLRTLQRMLHHRQISSVELTQGYLDRIAHLNPTLHAVIETNPDALSIAAQRDRDRHRDGHRGPLHGIPVIVKDNISTKDRMQTTAGSLALVGSTVPADADLVRRLRRAGAIILGKANLSEWANFRGGSADFPPINGWSARGGFTRNPYRLDLDPCGSSSGSAAAAAASLCAVAVGTETDGSILCPSGEQSLVGIKPTLGLVSQGGIIPIAHSQDTAGPMTRTVRDAALLLDAIRVPGRTVMGHRVPSSYAHALDDGGAKLKGLRLAYDRRYVDGPLGPGDDDALAVIDDVLVELRRHGATIVDVTSLDPFLPDDTGRIPFDDEFTVLLYEFKVQIAEYLAGLGNTSMHTLADLIQFNTDHCDEELKWFGQEVFELAQTTSGNLADPEYLAAHATNQGFGRRSIDDVLRQGFDAIITPSFSFGTSPAAVGGYPSMAVPVGYKADGHPVGLWLAASFMQESRLIRVAHAIEQQIQARVAPTLAGAVPADPAPFPGCDAAPTARTTSAQPAHVHHHGAMHPRHW
jgi:amidase